MFPTINTSNRIIAKKTSKQENIDKKRGCQVSIQKIELIIEVSLKFNVRVQTNGKWFIILSLRITFGDTSGPVDVCLFSDIICDTIKNLLACKSWDENQICSDFVKNIPPAEDMNNNISFAEASESSVDIPVEDTGKFNVYIDDFIGITVGIGNTHLDSK